VIELVCMYVSMYLRTYVRLSVYVCIQTALLHTHTHTHTHTVLTAIFPGKPGLASCPLNYPPFKPGLCILLGQA